MLGAGIVPGQRMRVTLRVPTDSAITPPNQRRVEGRLLDLDSTGVTLRLENGSVRRFDRAQAETLSAYDGRSRGLGVVAGWAVAIPLGLIECRDVGNECAKGQTIGLAGAVLGYLIGWPHWRDVTFPPARYGPP
jgi:hypothetical protein